MKDYVRILALADAPCTFGDSAVPIVGVLSRGPTYIEAIFKDEVAVDGTDSTEKIIEAMEIVKRIRPDLVIDGELQADAALVPEVAKIKAPRSPLKGRANVLIFPNLEAGNISYKLTQRLAKARALGPLLMGLQAPCSDLSRGCSWEDIVDVVAVTALRHTLYKN